MRKLFWAINVGLTDNLIAGGNKAGVKRLVQVSSPSAVFDGTDHVDADESLPYPKKWLNQYSAAKAESEKRVLAANHSYSIKRARSDLGYNPKIAREEGLRRFYEWAEKEGI